MRLEASVLAELRRRTEGWAASLQLIRAALNDRDPGQVRSFISSLSGAEGHLYEYLAEEVIGELPADLQQFLMRTSVLETVDLILGPIAAEVSVEEATRLIELGEQHGLLGKGGPKSRHVVRSHPLVREFLGDRLRRAVGADGRRAIHRQVAEAAVAIDWRVAVRHFIDGGSSGVAANVMANALEEVLATGAYTAAVDLVGELPDGALPGAPGMILRSKIALQGADAVEGLQLAEAAWRSEPASTSAILNLVGARTLAGDVASALEANALLGGTGHSVLSEIASAFDTLIRASVGGRLDMAERELGLLAGKLTVTGQRHFLGVALLNLALVQHAMGKHADALDSSTRSVDALLSTSARIELVAARLAKAQALAYRGEIGAARSEMSAATNAAPAGQALELALEVAQLEALVGSAAIALETIQATPRDLTSDTDDAEQAIYARALVNIATGQTMAAQQDGRLLRFGVPRTAMAFEARRHLLVGLIGILSGEEGARDELNVGTDLAIAQQAWLWADYGRVLLALSDPLRDPSSIVAASGNSLALTMAAEVVAETFAALSEDAVAALINVAGRMPERWRAPVRRKVALGSLPELLVAARILEHIGEISDIPLLRAAERRLRVRRGGRPGYALARRLAHPVFVQDLGRLHIVRGTSTVDGHEVRRKVLALLCLLLTRPRMALTREEVVDNLWPDHDPTSALNSLNQTVYFLRRVFEPDYDEALSPGYVGQDGETIWLDEALVSSASRKCLDIIRSMPDQPTPDGALTLASEYRGRFALDFAYEEWAAAHRDSLHAAYLRVIEHSVRLDMDAGHLARATFLAERAAEADPDSEEIQLALARLYRQSGAFAAASEQYGRYAQLMRDLGVDPIPLEEL